MATDFGRDLSCVTDLDPAMTEVSGRLVLSQALVRRLLTPTGGIVDDPDYGYDLGAQLNDDLTTAQVAQIAPRVDLEFLKDERVFASSTEGTFLAGVVTLSSLVTSADGPFRLTLAADGVTVTILRVG